LRTKTEMDSQNSIPLSCDAPFPVNSGATQVCRTIGSICALPTSGPCAIPHVPEARAFPGRDAVGRICVADGLGRLYAGFPLCHVTTSTTAVKADFVFGVLRDSAVALEKQIERGMLGFCVLNETRVMCVARGSWEEACAAYPTKVSDKFPRSDETSTGLSQAQLLEVNKRLSYCYRQYGVGALSMSASGFTYQVLVPNAQEYALHQAAYDAEQKAKGARQKHESCERELWTRPPKRARLDAADDC